MQALSQRSPVQGSVCTSQGHHFSLMTLDEFQRGTVGETIMHACLLLGLKLYADLAKRLLYIFPKLIADIYIDDVYYGEF